MRRHPLVAAFGLTLIFSPWLGAAEAGQPADIQTPDPFEQSLLQMESTIARLRATSDPAERQRLLREHARSLQQAMRLSVPGGARMAHPPRGGSPGMPARHLWGPGNRAWGPGDRRPARHAGRMPPERPGHQRRQGAPGADVEQRLDEQQLILDEILKYREPFEQLLQQQGLGQ